MSLIGKRRLIDSLGKIPVMAKRASWEKRNPENPANPVNLDFDKMRAAFRHNSNLTKTKAC